MARRQRKAVPKGLIECDILKLSHEGRGIAKLAGKTQFVEGALPGERVKARYLSQRGTFDELQTVELMNTSDQRISPPCKYAGSCGGCSLQHMQSDAQLQFKQSVLEEQFAHFGQIAPDEWANPLCGPSLGYRTKARLAVRYLAKNGELLIGFREKGNKLIANINGCAVLDLRASEKIEALRTLLTSLSVCPDVTHIEIATGEVLEEDDETIAFVIRHTAPMIPSDMSALSAFGQQESVTIYVQPGDASTVQKVWPESGEARLFYGLSVHESGSDEISLRMGFHPMDFTQVNGNINRQMVQRALEWLDVGNEDQVLDLFCGLGNFTLPLAKFAKQVVGVEADEAMLIRGRENARRNDVENVAFFAANLQADFTNERWAKDGFDKILIDPPRSGALDVVNHLAKFGSSKVVYVSCNPATLARDAGVLIEKGYRMLKAGVMDMFPHTTHVESIALFERVK